MKIVGWTSFDSECQGIGIDNKQTMVAALNETIDVIAKNEYVFSGEAHQNGVLCVPVFDNGKCLRCSMRGWGTLMSIAHTGSPDSYMDYYMNEFVGKEKFPEDKADESTFVIDKNVADFPYYCANQDVNLVTESLSMGMPLMTFDSVVLALYDLIKAEMEEE